MRLIKNIFYTIVLLVACNIDMLAQAPTTVAAEEVATNDRKKRRTSADPRLLYQAHSWYLYVGSTTPNTIRNHWRSFEGLGSFKNSRTIPYLLQIERTFDNGYGLIVGANSVGGTYSWKQSIADSNGNAILFNQSFKYASTALYVGCNYHIYYNTLIDIYSTGSVGAIVTSLVKHNEGEGSVAMVEPTKPSPFYYNIAIGSKFNFNKRLGLYTELGAGRFKVITLGAQYRLNKVKVRNRRGQIRNED